MIYSNKIIIKVTKTRMVDNDVLQCTTFVKYEFYVYIYKKTNLEAEFPVSKLNSTNWSNFYVSITFNLKMIHPQNTMQCLIFL